MEKLLADPMFPIIGFIFGGLALLFLLGVCAQIVGYRYTKGVDLARRDEQRRYNAPPSIPMPIVPAQRRPSPPPAATHPLVQARVDAINADAMRYAARLDAANRQAER